MRQESQQDRFEREAHYEVSNYLATQIVGLRRIVNQGVHCWPKDGSTNDGDPAHWWAEAEVEYINKVGGVERTNIEFHFKFSDTNDDLAMHEVGGPKQHVELDYRPWIEEEAAAEGANLKKELAELSTAEVPEEEQKRLRENILESLKVALSNMGENQEKYESAYIQAMAVLNVDQERLSDANNQAFLDLAGKTIRFLSRANDKWLECEQHAAHRYSPKSREYFSQGLTTLTRAELSQLQEAGNPINFGNFKVCQTDLSDPDQTTFWIPYKGCFTLYWNAVSICIDKMKNDPEAAKLVNSRK